MQPLIQSAFKSTKYFLCFLLVSMLFHAKVVLNAFFYQNMCFFWERVEVPSHSMSGLGLKCLAVCFHMGSGKMQYSSACTEMSERPFGILNFDLKSSNLGDPNWFERIVRVLLGMWVGSFLELPIGAPPLVVEGNSAFGFPGPWKSQGSAGAIDNFLGG